MRRYKSHTNGERYVGNITSKVVHDLDNEKPQCRIDETIESGNDVAFKYWYEAKLKNYFVCNHCFGVLIDNVKK